MDGKSMRTALQSPLGSAFFSEFNRAVIQSGIVNSIKAQTNVDIGDQNDMDLQALMRSVYSDMASDPDSDIRGQVARMNSQVISVASKTVKTGLLQQLVYLRDISSNPVPLETPISTSTYGNKIPSNFKFGIF